MPESTRGQVGVFTIAIPKRCVYAMYPYGKRSDFKERRKMNDKYTTEELSVRRFGGNGEVLCSFDCPFNSIVDDNTGFCSIFKRKLTYHETGNNDLCYRCEECKEIAGGKVDE